MVEVEPVARLIVELPILPPAQLKPSLRFKAKSPSRMLHHSRKTFENRDISIQRDVPVVDRSIVSDSPSVIRVIGICAPMERIAPGAIAAIPDRREVCRITLGNRGEARDNNDCN